MKFSQGDREWVATEITRQVAAASESLKPRGFKKLAYWLRDWGIVGTNITVILALLGLTLTSAYYAFSRVGKESAFETKTGDRLEALEAGIKDIRSNIEGIKVRQASSNPADPRNAKETKEILAEAKKGGVIISDSDIKQAGTSFLDASKAQPQAWEAALELVSYHTIINKDLLAVGTAGQIATTPTTELETHYTLFIPPGYPTPQMSVGGDVPSDQAATMHPVNEPPLDQGGARGKQVILIEGGGLQIDGWFIKDAVIRDTAIVYQGGPLVLQNVIFVNCVFILKNEPAPRRLANTILASTATTFDSASTSASVRGFGNAANSRPLTSQATL